MIPGRQMGRPRAVARAVAKNAGIPPKLFDKLWDEYEKAEYKHRKDYGAVVAEYANPDVTKAFKELDRKARKREYNKRYREQNKEKIREYNKKYWEENKERCSEKRRQWYDENREKWNAYQLERYHKRKSIDKEAQV